ncbi:hypothetical protein BDD12DRAFT_162904 [Trichophaea hybrida]|nr:hypothetical protein BDD12DRAFT_162904 [Trichophaea hybrida]
MLHPRPECYVLPQGLAPYCLCDENNLYRRMDNKKHTRQETVHVLQDETKHALGLIPLDANPYWTLVLKQIKRLTKILCLLQPLLGSIYMPNFFNQLPSEYSGFCKSVDICGPVMDQAGPAVIMRPGRSKAWLAWPLRNTAGVRVGVSSLHSLIPSLHRAARAGNWIDVPLDVHYERKRPGALI